MAGVTLTAAFSRVPTPMRQLNPDLLKKLKGDFLSNMLLGGGLFRDNKLAEAKKKQEEALAKSGAAMWVEGYDPNEDAYV